MSDLTLPPEHETAVSSVSIESGAHSDALLGMLISRSSTKFVIEPGPSDKQIEQALVAVACAPDHAKLRLWRFVMIKQPDIVTVGEQAIAILAAQGRAMTEEKQAATRSWLAQVPLLVAMAYEVRHDHPKVPHIEQTLSMGAGVMNFQNAMHAMGFASFWSTGLASFTQEMPEYLGFDTLDTQFVGFLVVGTPKNPPLAKDRAEPNAIARYWQAP
jgi:nitroreductase